METKTITQAVNKLMMVTINVRDMARARSFYVEMLGLKSTTDYRIDDNNWWVSLIFPGGGATLTLARTEAFPESIKPGMISLYFETSDVFASHNELSRMGIAVNEIQDDLFGPGSGVKFFNFNDPDGNLIHFVEEHDSRVPF